VNCAVVLIGTDAVVGEIETPPEEEGDEELELPPPHATRTDSDTTINNSRDFIIVEPLRIATFIAGRNATAPFGTSPRADVTGGLCTHVSVQI
jgi:hypothetical protein